VGFANFPGQSHPAWQGPLDRFVLRGLIIFDVIRALLLLPWKQDVLLWLARDTSPGPGCLLCFEKFAEPTSQNKAGTPALVE
uniref:hypothetical protein n=1 Tax=Collinsella sp. TaxID=1965294 RepID=UPI003FF0E302